MKRNKFTERQIFNILKEGESGALIVPDLCRKHGVAQVRIINGNQNMAVWKPLIYLGSKRLKRKIVNLKNCLQTSVCKTWL